MVVKPNDFQLLAVRVHNGVHRYTNNRTTIFTRHMYIPALAEASIICRPCVCTYILCNNIWVTFFYLSHATPSPPTPPTHNNPLKTGARSPGKDRVVSSIYLLPYPKLYITRHVMQTRSRKTKACIKILAKCFRN